MAVASTALITLAELATYPGMPAAPTAAETAILEPLIDACSLAIERECGAVALVRRAFTEDYYYDQILRPARGNPKILLRRRPIVSVGTIVDQASNTIPATDYWVNKVNGWIETTGGWNIPQDAQGFATYWTITYSGGHFAATANVDANLKLACKMLVAGTYNRPDPDVVSKKVGDLGLNYAASSSPDFEIMSIPPRIALLIGPYKGRSV